MSLPEGLEQCSPNSHKSISHTHICREVIKFFHSHDITQPAHTHTNMYECTQKCTQIYSLYCRGQRRKKKEKRNVRGPSRPGKRLARSVEFTPRNNKQNTTSRWKQKLLLSALFKWHTDICPYRLCALRLQFLRLRWDKETETDLNRWM